MLQAWKKRFLVQVLIEAVENVGRCQRSDHIKKAINYVKILLEKQAEPNARDEWGSAYAIHYAIWCGQLEVVKILLETENCNIEADTGTPLRLSQRNKPAVRCNATARCSGAASISTSANHFACISKRQQAMLSYLCRCSCLPVCCCSLLDWFEAIGCYQRSKSAGFPSCCYAP